MLQAIDGVDNMQNILALRGYQGINDGGGLSSQKVKEKFLTLFYKEIFKQAFKPPNLTVLDKETKRSVSSVFSSDMLAEWMAAKLASSKSFSIDALFPSVVGD